jgi:hypothetical protein
LLLLLKTIPGKSRESGSRKPPERNL